MASRRVAIIVGQVFFTGFIPGRFECGADRGAHRVGISACNGNLVGAPLPFYPTAGRLFHGAGPPCSLGFHRLLYRETINKIYVDAYILPLARGRAEGVKVVLPNGARNSRDTWGSKRNNIANSIRPRRTPSGL